MPALVALDVAHISHSRATILIADTEPQGQWCTGSMNTIETLPNAAQYSVIEHRAGPVLVTVLVGPIARLV
jgi:hypothetical protein